MSDNSNKLVRDIVCGMWLKPREAAGIIDYNGKRYYFCSPACKISFCSNVNYFITEYNKTTDKAKNKMS